MLARASTLAVLIAAGVVATTTTHAGVSASTQEGATPRYVGSPACAPCHASQTERWRASPHALAMRGRGDVAELANLTSPLVVAYGSDATATLTGGTEPSVTITEADVEAGPYEIPLVLGGRHISQPLVSFPGGRLQALPVGYDHEKGGWFDLFAQSPRGAEDWGHWTNRGMTANSECIACHVTGFRKGYDQARDAYETSYAEGTVGCEACHGPGSIHVEARRRAQGESHAGASGSVAGATAGQSEAGAEAAARNEVPPSEAYATPAGEALLAVCASCHALRRELVAEFTPGAHLLDVFEPVLLQEGDYSADGSLYEEAYEWGSFLQSRMHQVGVVCADCHDSHASDLKADGDALCRSCHDHARPRINDSIRSVETPPHSHHDDAAAGTTCVSCHMPETVFMQRDRRRDHSFSLPDPTLSKLAGTKSACVACHGDKGETWAAARVEQWFPRTAEKRAQRRLLVEAFVLAAAGEEGSVERVLRCARECDSPIRRATAAKLLAPFAQAARDTELRAPANQVVDALLDLARDQHDLVRYAAVWSLAESGHAGVADVGAALVAATTDSRRAVRVNTAWGLRALDRTRLEDAERAGLERASEDLRVALSVRADSAEARFTAGSFHEARGEVEAAKAEYRSALRIAPASVPPRYRLSMLLVAAGKLDDAAAELTALVEHDPRFAPAHFALGLLHGEQEDWREAVRSLTECLKLDPYYPEALRNLAHAYVGLGQSELATEVLEAALTHPRARAEALAALVSLHLALEDRDQAKRWARRAAGEIHGLRADATIAELLAE